MQGKIVKVVIGVLAAIAAVCAGIAIHNNRREQF